MSDDLVDVDDLAALLLLDEYGLQLQQGARVDEPKWLRPSTPLGSPVDSEDAKSVPASPCSIEEAEQRLEEEQRRRRHRESMARYRQERRDRVDTMKGQEQALQRILMQVLGHKKHIAGNGEGKTALQLFQARFTELVRARETLLLEKDELTSKLVLHDQRARAFQSLSDQSFARSMFVFPRTPGGVWLRYDEDEAPFYYEPVQEEQCRKTIALGLKKMAEMLRTLPQSNLPIPPVIATSRCMGWQTERAFTSNERNDPVMLFRFSRRVLKTRATLDQMFERSWKIYSTPDVMSRSSASSVRTQLVQQVHDDIVLMIRNAPEKKHSGQSRYLGLYHRMPGAENCDPRHGRCAMIFSMLMNRAPKEDMDDMTTSLGNSNNWLRDGCALLRLTEKPTTAANHDGGIDVEYMGYLEVRDLTHGQHMWTELCLLMMLWEQAVAPQQLLTG